LTGSLVARFSEPKKIARKVFYYQVNMKHYDAKKMQKVGFWITRVVLQRFDEWSILGMNHGHLW
jgi:hypothetical protein